MVRSIIKIENSEANKKIKILNATAEGESLKIK